MNGVSFAALAPAIIASSLVAVELFFRLPFLRQVEAVTSGAMKAVGVVSSPRISDHWKERVLPTYALRILRASLGLAGLLLLCAGAFTLAWVLLAWWPSGGLGSALDQLGRGSMQVILLAVCVGWAVLRSRLVRGRGKPASDYSTGSQLLHRLALSNDGMRRLWDDIDCRLAGARVHQTEVVRPVYVASLARAGTTVLLEALYASGQFVSLTYRAMPFVMAPWTWGALSKPGRADSSRLRERAHGDRIRVGVDSPEAFEEVFWSTHAGRESRDVDGLRPVGEPTREVLDRYRGYVQRVVARDAARHGGRTRRYLCKNNNNLLRLAWLHETFEDALIVTPFRDPADHVQSLLRQHRRFLERHRQDPFSLEYMDWLGHFEFGAHFMPFKMGPGVVPASPEELQDPAYWAEYWAAVYGFLLDRHGDRLIWFDYDRFCEEPTGTLVDLEEQLGLESGLLTPFAARVEKSARVPDRAVVEAITPACREVHAELRHRAHATVQQAAPIPRPVPAGG